MPDTVVRIGESLIQHGPTGDRIYALELSTADMPQVLDRLDDLAREEGYGKLIAKGRRDELEAFEDRDYRPEAVVPEFFGPGEDGLFMGKFPDPDRARLHDPQRIEAVLEAARAQAEALGAANPEDEDGREVVSGEGLLDPLQVGLPERLPHFELREAAPEELHAFATCYETVFESYPFPIQDPEHLRSEQDSGTRFFGAWRGGALVAAASMEPGGAPGTVEMTDFATLPSQRGQGLATRLLALMDTAAADAGQRVAYTIARAVSFGMNITFARQNYAFAGTLANNTPISGSIESMNVWYKLLGRSRSGSWCC